MKESSLDEVCFWRVWRLEALGPFSMGPGESRSRPREVEGMPDWSSFRASSPEYELEMLCESAISRAVSIMSSHSCAEAAVAEPSDSADFGSSKV